MFRCVTELKGLVIDIDSFEDINFEFWYDINKSYKCLFITVYDETETEIVQMFGQAVNAYFIFLLPEFDLCNRLVGEGVGHNERGMACGATEVDEATIG